MNNYINKYTCVFGGGAIRGIAYIGAMKALKELDIECDKLAGSSVGAVFAALYALNYSIEETEEIMLNFNAFMFKDINFGLGTDFAFSKGEVFENWIRENIERKFYGEKYSNGDNPPVTFRDIEKSLYICSTDLVTNKQFIFSKTNTPDYEIAKAVRISACFPGLMKPVEYDGKILVDGDLAKSVPLWKCSDELLTPDSRILEFRLEGSNNYINIKSTLDYFNAVYSTMSNFSTEHIISLYKNQDKIDYILIDIKDILMLDFQLPVEIRKKISENGYVTTMNYFTKTLVEKRKQLLPIYKNVLEMLKETKSAIKKGNANTLKRILSEYLCNFDDNYTNMDILFVEDLIKFKNSLLNNIKERGLIPIPKISNKTANSKILQGLIEKCEYKIDEISSYINKYSEKDFAV